MAPASAPLPLRWGDAATRRWAGVWLIVGGGVSIAGSNTEALWVLAMGTVAHVAGWCILPSDGWRRTVAVGPATLATWLLLAGPRFVFVLVVPYLLWLLVQHRRGLSALTAIPVAVVAVLAGNLLWNDGFGMLPALTIVAVTIVAADRLALLFERRH